MVWKAFTAGTKGALRAVLLSALTTLMPNLRLTRSTSRSRISARAHELVELRLRREGEVQQVDADATCDQHRRPDRRGPRR